ncbi:MAG TPA: cell division ATP-binding protein FtsE [Firmicutes bacterium]|nr:cell division ATP-binding protein FtsE [Bacillota bacterium]
MIEFQRVTKIYGGHTYALNDVSLKINKGEFVFLVGPSGAGKSTFVRLLLREELPTKGKIIVDGVETVRLRPKQIPFFRRRIGMVFQDFRLLPERTVSENVAFALRVVEAPRRDIYRRVPQVLHLVGLAHKSRAMPTELSGGEQQRVALARALVNNPPILLADEPTGNLDPENSWEIMRLLLEINRRGTTVVVATHAHEIVDRMRRRVVALEAGRVVRDEEKGAYGGEI